VDCNLIAIWLVVSIECMNTTITLLRHSLLLIDYIINKTLQSFETNNRFIRRLTQISIFVFKSIDWLLFDYSTAPPKHKTRHITDKLIEWWPARHSSVHSSGPTRQCRRRRHTIAATRSRVTGTDPIGRPKGGVSRLLWANKCQKRAHRLVRFSQSCLQRK